jgi:hypothetical protein
MQGTKMDEGQTPPSETRGKNRLNWRQNENSWIIGLSILLMGAIFLVQNRTGWQMEQWWYAFLFVPALASFVTAWRRSKEREGFPRRRILRPLALGLFLLATMFVLLFNLGWSMILVSLLLTAGFVLIIGIWIK